MPNRDLVVIGASAGGLPALYAILGGMPSRLPAAIVIVLHTRLSGGVAAAGAGPAQRAAGRRCLRRGRPRARAGLRRAGRSPRAGRRRGAARRTRSARERVPARHRSAVPHGGPDARAGRHRRHPLGRARRRRLRVERVRPPRRRRHRAGSRRRRGPRACRWRRCGCTEAHAVVPPRGSPRRSCSSATSRRDRKAVRCLDETRRSRSARRTRPRSRT